MSEYQVGAYYFPNWHVDPRNVAAHGEGWTEWELLKRAQPRFPGHKQPRVPQWGYEDESDPVVMAKKIDAAADHGLSHFIFDWYHYEDGPFLERALEQGFLRAPNNHRFKFALMWANHAWYDIHPCKKSWRELLQFPGVVTAAGFERIADLVIERYFKHPSYWCVEGKPYFSFYELMTFVKGLGGIAPARAALERFRAKAIKAGLPGIHINAVIAGVQILPGEEAIKDPNGMMEALGLDSASSYVWIHHVPLREFPATQYQKTMPEAEAHWRKTREELVRPFHPNVTMGWDASPRVLQSDIMDGSGYPFMSVLVNNTPALFQEALQRCRQFLDEQKKGPKILSINAWNEWTEGSYLEPDQEHGLAYLEAVRRVFGAGKA